MSLEQVEEVAMKDGYVKATVTASKPAKTMDKMEIHQPEEHARKDIFVERMVVV